MNYDVEIEKYYRPENFEPLHEYEEEFLNNPDETNKHNPTTDKQENS